MGYFDRGKQARIAWMDLCLARTGGRGGGVGWSQFSFRKFLTSPSPSSSSSSSSCKSWEPCIRHRPEGRALKSRSPRENSFENKLTVHFPNRTKSIDKTRLKPFEIIPKSIDNRWFEQPGMEQNSVGAVGGRISWRAGAFYWSVYTEPRQRGRNRYSRPIDPAHPV